jgi:7-cyano-7-deazaguanine synthase in queuosine biosynthesis
MRVEVRESAEGVAADLVLVPGGNLVTGQAELSRQLGSELSSLEQDLLTLGAAVFAADLAVRRGEREQACRAINLSIPVVNADAFERARDDLQYALHLLSRDVWRLEFVRRGGIVEQLIDWPSTGGRTLLFSGGLDSLAAATSELRAGGSLVLVSHYTGNPRLIASQTTLLEYLAATYGRVPSFRVRVGGRTAGALTFPDDTERESSQRTRSFLFVLLAAVVARRSGNRDLVMMSENGPLAIHLALSTARLGPFSTHTAHPEYLDVMADVASRLLGVRLTISNPFLYYTKAEVVRDLVANDPAAIPASVSCWRGSRQAVNHCGECIPCLIRRFALESLGYMDDEYARDLLSEDPTTLSHDDDGLRNLTDLLEFSQVWATPRTEAALLESFPELVNGSIDQPLAISMYRRFGAEIVAGARTYPHLSRLVGP